MKRKIRAKSYDVSRIFDYIILLFYADIKVKG